MLHGDLLSAFFLNEVQMRRRKSAGTSFPSFRPLANKDYFRESSAEEQFEFASEAGMKVISLDFQQNPHSKQLPVTVFSRFEFAILSQRFKLAVLRTGIAA